MIKDLQTIDQWGECKGEQPSWTDNFIEDYMAKGENLREVIDETNSQEEQIQNLQDQINNLTFATPTISLGINNAQSVTSSTDTPMDFNVEYIKDSEFDHDTGVNPSQITVNEDGRYKISGFISINGTTGNYRYNARCAIRINGTTTSQYIDSSYIRAATGHNENCITVFDILDLNQGDYIEVMVARINSTVGNGVTTANRTKVIIEKTS